MYLLVNVFNSPMFTQFLIPHPGPRETEGGSSSYTTITFHMIRRRKRKPFTKIIKCQMDVIYWRTVHYTNPSAASPAKNAAPDDECYSNALSETDRCGRNTSACHVEKCVCVYAGVCVCGCACVCDVNCNLCIFSGYERNPWQKVPLSSGNAFASF